MATVTKNADRDNDAFATTDTDNGDNSFGTGVRSADRLVTGGAPAKSEDIVAQERAQARITDAPTVDHDKVKPGMLIRDMGSLFHVVSTELLENGSVAAIVRKLGAEHSLVLHRGHNYRVAEKSDITDDGSSPDSTDAPSQGRK
jgi:hypothetical protein